ncbi:hypothetical protein [Agrobacterium larrymoorei]|uniref:Uncharacterized protein n=1 Tax=Agrobacterium larrymoorei TaxID=160699 RepID=A0AAF0HAL2_9HYPH|nr:hypothetical protein [Agrobacterium larrymoorei]WHA40914.1 hypothetical protein CFBP5477_014050 [Agrobacterium larrymoorei]
MADIDARLKARELLEASFELLQQEGIQAALDYIQVSVAPQLSDLQAAIGRAQAAIDEILGGNAPNAQKLGGQPPSYYATAQALTDGLASNAQEIGVLIEQRVAALVDSSPAALDTLKELATAIGNDPDFAVTMTNAIAKKLETAGGTMTGPLLLAASVAAAASLRIPHGTGPSVPVNGDLWTTTAGLLARINGVTRTFFDNVNLVKVSQAEAEAGTATTARLWAAQQVFQAIAAYLAVNAPQPFTGTYNVVSLAINTPRQNTSGKPMFVVAIMPGNSNLAGQIALYVGTPGSYSRVGVDHSPSVNAAASCSAVVAPGEYYYWLLGHGGSNASGFPTPTLMEKT